jgi:hypothetical protein
VTAPLVAANLGGIALFALPGLGVAELVPALARMAWWRRLGFAYLLGVVAVGASLFAASHLFGVALRRPAIAAAVAVPLLAGIGARAATSARGARRWRRRRAGRTEETPRGGASPRPAPAPAAAAGRRNARRWQVAAGIAIAAIFLGTLASALSLPLGDWDGRLAWGAQAAYMRHEGTVDAAVLRQAPWFIVHPRYPPLLPLAQVAVQEMFGAGVDEELFRGVYAAFLAALLLILYQGASRAAGPAAATLATLCAVLPRFLSFGMGSATSAYSDLPLACFYGAALILLLLAAPRRATGLAAGCLLAGMVLAKSEGTFLAVAALCLAALRLLRRHHGRSRPQPAAAIPGHETASGTWCPVHPLSLFGGALRSRAGRRRIVWLAGAALPPLAAAALLAAWRGGVPNRYTTDFFTGLRPGDFVRGAANRLPEILRGIVAETFHAGNWYGFWALFLLVLLAGRRALRRPAVRGLLAAGLVPLAIGVAAYCVNPTLGTLISQTWSRFLIQGLVPLALVLAVSLHEVLRQLRPAARTSPAPAPDGRENAADEGAGALPGQAKS